MNMMTNFNAATALATGLATSPFEAAMIVYEAADAEMHRVLDDADDHMSDAVANPLCITRGEAFRAVTRTPATSWPEFGRKVAMVAQDMIEFEADEAFGAVHLLADVVRLVAPSPARAAFSAAAQSLEVARAAVEMMPWETDAEEAAGDAAVDAVWDQRRAFMAMPAPDFASVVDKLRALKHPEVIHCHATVQGFLETITADAERLSGIAHLSVGDGDLSRAAWDAAVDAFEAADAADMADPDGDQEELQDAMCDARDLIFDVPAPDNAALAYKIALASRFDMWGDGFLHGAPTRSIASDANRLAGLTS